MTTLDNLPPRWRRLLDQDDETLATTLVEKPDRQMKAGSAKSKSGHHVLGDHLIHLQLDHVGQPLANLQHAALIVLIRREIALEAALERYFALWERHGTQMLQGLSLRWIVSAADTFADHGRDPAERATGLAVALMVNTIKLYETERLYWANDKMDEIEDAGLPVFNLDGIVGFRIERGDTIGNMYKRKDRVISDLGIAGRLLNEAMVRINQVETVYARFRKLHKSKAHMW